MSYSTFFFREGYTSEEIYERIYAEDFIEVFKQYSLPDEEINKTNCYIGISQAFQGDKDAIDRQLRIAFEQVGRKGDKLHVKLFKINNILEDLSEELKTSIQSLVDDETNIREKDSLSSGLENDIYLVDVNFNENLYIDMKFRFDFERVEHDPIPTIRVRSNYIELRYYFKQGIVAVHNPSGNQKSVKNILSILYLLCFQHGMNYDEVNFDEAQLIMIQLRLKGEVSSPKLRSADDLRIGVYGVNEINYQQPIVRRVEEEHSLKIYELSSVCVIEGHECLLRITEEGKINIDRFVTPVVLDSIISNMHWVIELKDFYLDFETQLDKIYKKKQPGSLVSFRQNKIKSVRKKIYDLINVYKEEGAATLKEPNLIATIVLNIGHFLCKDKLVEKIFSEDYADYTTEEYEEIVGYYVDYLTIEIRLNRSESSKIAPKVVSVIRYLLDNSKGDSIELIDKFNSIKEEEAIC